MSLDNCMRIERLASGPISIQSVYEHNQMPLMAFKMRMNTTKRHQRQICYETQFRFCFSLGARPKKVATTNESNQPIEHFPSLGGKGKSKSSVPGKLVFHFLTRQTIQVIIRFRVAKKTLRLYAGLESFSLHE